MNRASYDDSSDPMWLTTGVVIDAEQKKNGIILSSISLMEAPSSSHVDNSHDQDKVDDNVTQINLSPSKDSSTIGIPDVSSPKNSLFRRSLDEEYRAKEKSRKRMVKVEGASQASSTTSDESKDGGGRILVNSSKHLLRQSIHSLSSTAGEVLTQPERNFLEMLLVSDEPGVEEACKAAHERLMDESIFSCSNVCDGGGCNDADVGEVGGRGPPRRLTSENIREDDSVDWIQGSNDEPWVQEWVTNSDEKKCSQEHCCDGLNKNAELNGQEPVFLSTVINSSSGGNEENTVAQAKPVVEVPPLARPYDLPLSRRSSEARLSRLFVRKEQASAGQDNIRLFRAHEAGLVITPSGSARRSLLRMGLPVEKGLFLPNLPLPTTTDANDKGQGENQLSSILRENDSGAFEKALAKMDERTIRLIEKQGQAALNKVDEREIRRMVMEERAGKDNRQLAESLKLSQMAGCVSPFNINALRSMFASKQMTFRQSSSSYTRFDSFLTTDVTEPGLFSDSSSVLENSGEKYDIFRPSLKPSTAEERFKNLLINAGFKNETGEDDNDELLDANTEDDEEIFRCPSNASVAILTKGGPSYRNVNMFRESPSEMRNPKESDIKDEMISAWESTLSKTGSLTPTPIDVNESTGDDVKVSPATSDSSDGGEIGDLPSSLSKSARNGHSSSLPGDLSDSLQLPPLGKRSNLSSLTSSFRASRERSSTMGIIKPTLSTSISPTRKTSYSRSVSWGHMVFSKDEEKVETARRESVASESSGLSILSFPHLRRAAPIRSDSIGSITSTVMTHQPLRLGAPLRSSSTFSASSVMSPRLARAHPVFSPMSSFMSIPPALTLARAIRSDSQITIQANGEDDVSLNSADDVDTNLNLPKRAAWERPVVNKSVSTGSDNCRELGVYIRQASTNFYEGMGMEVEDVPHLDSARKYRSMISIDQSTRSIRSLRRGSSVSIPRPPLKSLDDSFIIKNIDFERHSSEILRSLSNLDLYSSHHLETINGGSSKSTHLNADWAVSSTARVDGDILNNAESWDLESNNSYGQANAWDVWDDEYADFGDPFRILGTSANDTHCHPHVLSPPLMESLQNFFPPTVSENNFWLKYSLVRDGASLPSLLQHIRGSNFTLIAIETVDGEVFGSFTSSPWRKSWDYYGNGESFLWRMRRSRSEKDVQYSVLDQAKLETEVDVFYWTGSNDYVQCCTHDILAIGGGSLREDERDDRPDEKRDSPPLNPISKANRAGFGLAIDSNLLRGTSSSCATFQNPPLSKSHRDGSPFEILNIEVWTLTPFATVAEAENLEMTKLFLQAFNREL